MAANRIIPVALSIEGLEGAGSAGDARAGFSLAAEAGYRGVAFATNHPQLRPEDLGESARRHLRSILSGKGLQLESIRAAAPRGGLADPATIDRTLDNARKAMNLARELGVGMVSLNIGSLGGGGTAAANAMGDVAGRMPAETIVSALRELAQQADASGLKLALGADQLEELGQLLKRVDYDGARVNFDTAEIIAAGGEPLAVAEALAGRIGQWTANDALRAGRTVRAAMLGEGQAPVAELLELLREQGFDGRTGGGAGGMIVDVRDLPDGARGAEHAAAVLRRLMRR